MRRVIVIMILGLCAFGIKAQNSFYQKVANNDLPYPAVEACLDSKELLSVVCSSVDSIYAYKSDTGQQNWQYMLSYPLTRLYNTSEAPNFIKCFYVQDSFYVFIANRLYKQSGSSLILEDSFQGKVNEVYELNGETFILGSFDSIVGKGVISDIFKFDGSNYTSTSYNTDLGFNGITAVYGDTILISQANSSSRSINYYDAKNDRQGLYYSSDSMLGIVSLAASLDAVYFIGSETDQLYAKKRNGIIDTISLSSIHLDIQGNAFPNMIFDQQLFIKNTRSGAPDIYTLSAVDSLVGIVPYDENNEFNGKFFKGRNKLFYLPKSTIYNGVESLNIASIRLDSAVYFEYDTICLQTFIDIDSNGVYSGNDMSYRGNFSTSDNQYNTSFQDSGVYSIIVPDYKEYTFQARAQNSNACYSSSPQAGLVTDNLQAGKRKDTLIFPVHLKIGTPDPQVEFISSRRARLNDTIRNQIWVGDNGCGQMKTSGYVKVVLAPKTEFVRSIPAASSKNKDTLYFFIDSVGLNRSSIIDLDLKFSNIDFTAGDKVVHFAQFSTDTLQNRILLDSDSIITNLVYSYDPNEKIAQPSGIVTRDVDKIKYTIHFENEGNDVARKVVVKDSIDTRMPVIWFRMINSSHPYTVTIRNNVVTWTFENINLAAKGEDVQASQGYVSFEAKVNNPLAIGDSIRNKAAIYFDLNDAIITNYAVLRRKDNADAIDQVIDFKDMLKVYPNPANDVVQIQNLKNEQHQLSLYDINGKVIESIHLDASEKKIISLKSVPSGIYFLHLDETGLTYKILKL